MKIKYSFIIPVYNREKYIDRCLDSILKQKIFNIPFEVIIVDDGSIDQTEKHIRNYLSPHIHYLKIKHSGPYIARKIGIENAKGEYILFVDSDDYITEEYLKIIDQNIKDYDILKFGFYSKDAKKNFLPYDTDSSIYLKHLVSSRYKGYSGSLCIRAFQSNLFKKFLLENYHYYYAEDLMLLVHAYQHAKKLGNIKQVLYHIYPSDNSLTRSQFDERRFSSIEIEEKILQILKEYNQHYDMKKEIMYSKSFILQKVLILSLHLYLNNYKVYIKNKNILKTYVHQYSSFAAFYYLSWKMKIGYFIYIISPTLFFFIFKHYILLRKIPNENQDTFS